MLSQGRNPRVLQRELLMLGLHLITIHTFGRGDLGKYRLRVVVFRIGTQGSWPFLVLLMMVSRPSTTHRFSEITTIRSGVLLVRRVHTNHFHGDGGFLLMLLTAKGGSIGRS